MLNNIKSRAILNNMFNYLMNYIKLKLVRYNRGLQSKLHLELKDFMYFKKIRDFNIKYNSAIKNTDINEIDLEENNKILNSGLRYLADIPFKNLKLD